MREKINFSRDWKFYMGDVSADLPSYKGFVYISSKTERAHIGPACKDYLASVDSFKLNAEHNSQKWENVNLPHDYMLGVSVDKKYNNALGFVKRENAWYRKSFELSEDDRGKRLTLLFEGVSTHATVYLNGMLMAHNMCGYTTFEVDITDAVKFDAQNVLAVYVSTEQNEGWWYEGGGIYRHVWLTKTDLTSIDLWGIYAKPVKVSDSEWKVELEVTVRNDFDSDKDIHLYAAISDNDGASIAAAQMSGTVEYRDKKVFKSAVTVISPELWSPDSPVQYTVHVSLTREGEEVDTESVRFGFRTFALTPDKGFFINGKHYLIKGVCGHATCGLTGKAVPDNLYRHRVKMIKDMGANGYRTSHYPQNEALMDALDENGFIVMNETRWFESTKEGKEQLEMLVRRDRNRPSVFFWSIGNEEPHHTTDEGRRIASTLKAVVKKLDSERPVMVASDKPTEATVYDIMDAVGINYCYHTFDEIHEKYPDKMIIASECCATGSTRGWYGDVLENDARLPAYDRDTNSYFVGREKAWRAIASREFIAGCYQWIFMDHKGEAVWPRLCSVSGAHDMFYQRKDAFYQNLSHWSDTPMVHLLPHWNHKGLEGEPIKVFAYTNAERLELFLNGVSLGEQIIEKYGHGEWSVPYEAGALSVKAYNGEILVATDEKITTGAPARLKLTLETPDICANGEDIALVTCSVVDKDGNEIPDATPTVSFRVEGAGTFHTSGSDNIDHTSPFSTSRKMYAGKISVAVRTKQAAGEIKVFAYNEMLGNTVLKFSSY